MDSVKSTFLAAIAVGTMSVLLWLLLMLAVVRLDVFLCHCYVPTGFVSALKEFQCCDLWVLKHSFMSLTVHST